MSDYSAAATLSGPVSAGRMIEPLTGLDQDLRGHGYTEEEFFAAGTATAFRALDAPTSGQWKVAPTTSAPYRTRLIVRRPAKGRFNGTVVVEWLNVSAGEAAPDWDYLNPELMRSGYAYVGVSAQAVAVGGGSAVLGAGQTGLIHAEPTRYGDLHHPGDEYAFDMFAQIGRAVRGARGGVLGDLHPSKVVAVGESQSAFFLTTFADAVQPLTHAYDGLFIHSRGGGGADLTGVPFGRGGSGPGLRIRTDLEVPVFVFETETDLVELGYANARQPVSDRIRVWEVAGTAHADAYLVGAAAKLLGCGVDVNSGPQHEVAQAAFAAFATWVEGGAAPPSPSPIELASSSPAKFELDANGNVVGGVRTPHVDVPVSKLSGLPPAGASPICALFGSTTPFTHHTLVTLYANRATYLERYQRSLDAAIASGYILAADRAGLLAKAQLVTFGD